MLDEVKVRERKSQSLSIIPKGQLPSTFINFGVTIINFTVSRSQVEVMRQPDLEAI